jgi:hypothetical protein
MASSPQLSDPCDYAPQKEACNGCRRKPSSDNEHTSASVAFCKVDLAPLEGEMTATKGMYAVPHGWGGSARASRYQGEDAISGSRIAFSSASLRSLAVSFSGAFRALVSGVRTERPWK